VRYDDGETEENYELEWQQLKQLTQRRPARGIDLHARDKHGLTVEDYLYEFHGIDLERALEVEASSMHRQKKSRVYKQAEAAYAEIGPRRQGKLTPRQRLERWLRAKGMHKKYREDDPKYGDVFFQRYVDLQCHRLINYTSQQLGTVDTTDDTLAVNMRFDEFIVGFERIVRILKRERKRAKYKRNKERRERRRSAALKFEMACFEESENEAAQRLYLQSRQLIERNAGGEEEPHSDNPRLLNIGGTEVDMNATYEFAGQCWYLQSRQLEAEALGLEGAGERMDSPGWESFVPVEIVYED